METRDVEAIREARARGENYHMAQCEKSKSSKSRVRPAQFVPACQPGCEKMERERENKEEIERETMRKWRG